MNEQEYRTPDDIMKEIAKTYTELGNKFSELYEMMKNKK